DSVHGNVRYFSTERNMPMANLSCEDVREVSEWSRKFFLEFFAGGHHHGNTRRYDDRSRFARSSRIYDQHYPGGGGWSQRPYLLRSKARWVRPLALFVCDASRSLAQRCAEILRRRSPGDQRKRRGVDAGGRKRASLRHLRLYEQVRQIGPQITSRYSSGVFHRLQTVVGDAFFIPARDRPLVDGQVARKINELFAA